MPPSAEDLWNEAEEKKGQKIFLGQTVICDICNGDYTNSQESGGFIFGSYAYCPKCASNSLHSIKAHNETSHIKAYCPPDQSFASFILSYRGSDAFIRITEA